MLQLFMKQREATEELWPRQPRSPVQTDAGEGRTEKGGVDAKRGTRGASQSRAADAPNVDSGLAGSNKHGSHNVGKAGLLSSKGFSPTSPKAISGSSSNSARRVDGVAAAAPPPPPLSAYDLVTRLVAAATNEVNLLGVDDVTPHSWRRWAPHW